jgi:CRP-like cAMP-binding protein
MNKYIDVLWDCSLFKGKTKKEIKEILSLTNYKITHFNTKEFVCRADEPPKYLGIVLSGSVEIQNNLESGKYFNIFYKQKGETFGGALLFSDIPICEFNIIAKTECDILLINKQSVLKILLKDNVIGSNILSSISKNILLLNKKIELFSHSSIKQKIAYSLLYNIKFTEDKIVYLSYSKTDWAEHLNVSRPSLSRELKELCDNKIISIKNNQIEILDIPRLKAILGI